MSRIKGVVNSVVINIKSTFHNIETGIPQGTFFGPILFSLFQRPGIDLQMYADNTVVHVSGKARDAVEDKLTKTLENVSAWLDASCLTLKIKKMKSICFSIKRLAATEPLNVRIKGELNDQAQEVTY